MTTTREIIPNGIFPGIAAPAYHADPAVSNSALKIFSSQSPYHYKASLAIPREETDAMKRGTLFHTCILEPQKFGDGVSHFVRPEGLKFTTNEGKAWRDSHLALPTLTAEEHRNMAYARSAVLAIPQARALLSGVGSNETSIFATHPRTGLRLKCRADRLTEDKDGRPWIVDLKSTDDVRKFSYTARDFYYDQQGVFYPDVAALAGVNDALFVFIAVEIEPTYGVHGVRLVMLDDDTQRAARESYEAQLDRWAECESSGVWPGYDTGIEFLKVKRWIP